MHGRFPAIYRDQLGEESTELVIDGQELRIVVRGTEFAGLDFDMLRPVPGSGAIGSAELKLHEGNLIPYEIEFTIPISVVVDNKAEACALQIAIEVPRREGRDWNWPKAHLILPTGGLTLRSPGHSGHFESEMLDLQRQLPAGTYIKACINCAYSDYSAAGQDMLGMMCFRRDKAAYSAVRSKQDMFRVTSEVRPEYVQEFHLCPEFERRRPGTGYRG
jgi:hypothetical protein